MGGKARLQVVVLGKVCNKSHCYANVDAGTDGDGQHSQEESTSGAGAGMVQVPFIYCFVSLVEKKRDTEAKKDASVNATVK